MQFYVVLGVASAVTLGPVIAAAIWANRRPKR